MMKHLETWVLGLAPAFCLLGLVPTWEQEPAPPKPSTHFSEHLVADQYGYAYGLAATDRDNDGDLDLWFENAGDPRGPWRKHILKDKWPRANQVILADFNGDKRLDIAASAEQGANEVRWWRNEGQPGGK